ncbi:MAG: hypothetical protein Q4D02_08610, partial [Clostridia bacterium]|nr:hypothetical protein [Clostridia bacterium]
MKQENTSKGKNKKREQKRQTSIITVILWLFLVATMITITFSSIRKNNAVEKSELYDKIYVESATIEERKTGTGPFTTREDGTIPDIPEDGMDYSEDDNYVRTFDTVNYTVSTIMRPNTDVEGVEETSVFYGGTIKVKATIPAVDGQSHFKWVQQAWMQNVSMTDDGRTLYAEYKIADTQKSAPGVQSLNFEMKAEGYVTKEGEQAPKPTFEIYMEGNKEENEDSTKEKVILMDEKELYITGRPALDVRLGKGEINHPGIYNGKQGYYMNFAIILSIYQDIAEISDLKGLEYPTGEIVTKLKMKYLFRNITDNGSWTEVSDLDEKSYGVLNGAEIVAYAINGEENENFWPSSNIVINTVRANSNISSANVSGAGDINVDQQNDVININFNNYVLDGKFPTYGVSNPYNDPYKDGCFTVGQIELFVPNYDNDSDIDYDYNLSVEAIELNYSTNTVQNINVKYENDVLQDVVTTNNILSWKNSKSQLNGSIYFRDHGLNEDKYEKDDGYGVIGGTCKYVSDIGLNGLYSGGTKRLITWRSDVFELIRNSSNNYINVDTLSFVGFPKPTLDNVVLQFGVYKENKVEGLVTDELVNDTDFDDFEWYDNKDEIEKLGYKVTALYIRDKDHIGYNIRRKFEVTFMITSDDKYVNDNYIVRHKAVIYTDENEERFVKYGYGDYIKTQYEDNALKVNSSDTSIGQNILIVPYHVTASTSVDDLASNNKPKTTYDVNERIINFNIVPKLVTNTTVSDNDSYVDKIQVVDCLPKGLKYVRGSANKEPVSVTLDEETGITEIVWEYENWQI